MGGRSLWDRASNDDLDSMTDFASLGLNGALLSALKAHKFITPTPIQAGAIPAVLAGEDVLGIAQTGTGKTAAFGLPVLQTLSDYQGRPAPKTATAVVLCPTRELAVQITESLRPFAKRLRLSLTAVYGGVGKGPQIRDTARGVDLLVATPGRLRDLMEMRAVSLTQTEILILDEADRMLDMGFAPEVKRLAADMPVERQTVLFSATMPKEIRALANTLMTHPKEISVAPESTPVERIVQAVRFLERSRKLPALRRYLDAIDHPRLIAFTRTKRGADKLAKGLKADGIKVASIHGDKSQAARQRALGDFTKGRIGVLVATDLAARGIDVDAVSHVVNYDVPVDPESYVHRIGRTARNGATGTAITFCSPDELEALRAVEKVTRLSITVDAGHPDHLADVADRATASAAPGGHKPGNRSRRGCGRRGKNWYNGGQANRTSSEKPSQRQVKPDAAAGRLSSKSPTASATQHNTNADPSDSNTGNSNTGNRKKTRYGNGNGRASEHGNGNGNGNGSKTRRTKARRAKNKTPKPAAA